MRSWEQLEQACRDCQRCALADTRTNVVFGVGPHDAEIMMVGEGPGEHEDEQGIPFVGKAGQLLDEVTESIINAYELKTGLSRTRISHMMNDETWMNPVKAKELGFCDEILFSENDPQETGESMFFSSASVQQRVMNSLLEKVQTEKPETVPRTSASALADRLDRLKYDY